MQIKTIRQLIRWVFPLAIAAYGAAAQAEDEVTLFNARGAAEAYIAIDDGLTIYLWSGKPVAYLEKAGTDEGYNVYGFNGKHLGWFAKGAIYAHDGTAACATAQVMTSATQLEPLKSLKELKPLQSLTELSPLQPVLASRFGDTPCRFLLGAGSK
ncbi:MULTISPECIES: 4-fold beta flower protein [Paraburkholderia]|uniref:4-fold beta flower protein n=1 Tax=Paraburkholderia TaxID=1822464 RepID=UPI0038BAABA7